MNFLSGGCFTKYTRVKFWTTPCCKDLIKLATASDEHPKRQTCKKTELQPNLCPGNYKAVSFFTQFTQVRYQKDCPRLHRDMNFPSFDEYRKPEFKDVRKTGWGSGEEKLGTTYFISFFGLMVSAYGAKTVAVHFISYMSAAADVLAMASIEVDIANIAPGACLSFKWRGKPLFVKHRTPADIEGEANTPMSSLRDPQTPDQRTVKPEWLVVIGICTHLGCVPIPNSGDWAGGFYCPCHGSHYDNVGRTRKGPAPLNLEVPPHKFLTDTLVLVG